MKEPLVNIIIPVFNVDINLFEKCINSVFHQNYHNIEIIVIDDGSKERYANEIDAVCRKHSGIILKRKKNEGVSLARNYALKECKGEYIIFLDADDYFFDENAVSSAVNIAIKYEADIVIGQVALDFGENNLVKEQYIFSNEESVLEKDDELENISSHFLSYSLLKSAPYLTGLRRGIASRVFSRKCIEELCFNSKFKYGEDSFFDYQATKKASKVVLTNSVWYVYYQRHSSAIHQVEFEEALTHFDELVKIVPRSELFLVYERVANLVLHIATQQARKKGFQKKIKEILSDERVLFSLNNRKEQLFSEPLWKSMLFRCLRKNKPFLFVALIKMACKISDVINKRKKR